MKLLVAAFLLIASTSAYAAKLPHYVFVLPDGYTGWIQVIFQSPGALLPPPIHNKITIALDDSGRYKTSMLHAYFVGSRDEFFYRHLANGEETLIPIPSNFYCNAESGLDTCYAPSEENGADGFTVSRAIAGKPGPSRDGNSWFFFIGPPEQRAKNAVRVIFEPGTKKWMDHPENDPTPGRIKNEQ